MSGLNSGTLLIFSKTPEIGKVKTRFIKSIGAEAAFNLYLDLLKLTLENVSGVKQEKVLFLSRLEKQKFIRELIDSYGLEPREQKGSDLGERLAMAFVECSGFSNRLIVIGGDCVTVTKDYLEEAFARFDNYPCVIGPASDGGFVMLGFNLEILKEDAFKERLSKVFRDIEWGMPSVRKQLKLNLEEQGIAFSEMETLVDIDEPEDLLAIIDNHPEFSKYLA